MKYIRTILTFYLVFFGDGDPLLFFFFFAMLKCVYNILAWKIQSSFRLLHAFLLCLLPFVLLFLLCYIVSARHEL